MEEKNQEERIKNLENNQRMIFENILKLSENILKLSEDIFKLFRSLAITNFIILMDFIILGFPESIKTFKHLVQSWWFSLSENWQTTLFQTFVAVILFSLGIWIGRKTRKK